MRDTKKPFYKRWWFIAVATIIVISTINAALNDEEEPKVEPVKIETTGPADESEKDELKKMDFQTEAEANAIENPAKPGAMLYDKTESKYKGMNYHFKGTLVKVEKVEGLFDKMEDTLLVKNEQGYVMPIFPPYEVSAVEGDEIEVWGPLSGDGYASTDLGVDNVVGVAGAINATRIDVNGETK